MSEEDEDEGTLTVTLLTEEDAPEQLFELEISGLRFYASLLFEEGEISYEIYCDPHLEDQTDLMERVVECWLHGTASEVLDEIFSPD